MNLGQRMTDEQRARVSVGHKGQVVSPKARARIASSMFGISFMKLERRNHD